MKTMCRLSVMMVAVVALLLTGVPMPAFSQMKDMPMMKEGEEKPAEKMMMKKQ